MTKIISLERAAFGYGAVPIIEDISLEISAGEFWGIIGPNGAGKTTLLKGILGLLSPLKGHMDLADNLNKQIGYVPQKERLDSNYPLTVFDVVHMGLTGPLPWYHLFPKDSAHIIEGALKKVGMEDVSKETFSELSGGQRQRVLIARALVTNPRLLILDEPISGVDPIAQEHILKLLSRWNSEENLSIVMVSHHLGTLGPYIEKLAVVKDGRVFLASKEDIQHPERVKDLFL